MPAKSTARSSARKGATKRTAKTTTRKTAVRKPAGRKTAARQRTARSTAARRPPPARRGDAKALARIAEAMCEIMEQQAPPSDAIELLEHDHREVEALFDEFEDAEDSNEKAELARKICLALTVHAQIEETSFYPRARKAIDEGDLLDEAEVEHASAKQLIAEIQGMTPRDKLFDAKVKVLGEYVKHHVQEEENELFPKVRESGLDLEAAGKKLMKQKVELLEEVAGRG